MRGVVSAVTWGCLAAALPLAAHAEPHIYSYDSASPAARTLAPTGLSFEFEKPLFGSPIVNRIVQTGDRGSAELKPVSDAALGPGGLRAALDDKTSGGRLYEIEPKGDGAAFIDAICPGARRAWLVIGRMERFKDLSIQAIGKDDGAAKAHHCVTLELSFRTDWEMPQRAAPRQRASPRGPQ